MKYPIRNIKKDLLDIIFEFVNPEELLAVVLTSRRFLGVCRQFDLMLDLETCEVHFCHSREGIRWVIACGCPTDSISAHVVSTCQNEEETLNLLQWTREEGLCEITDTTCHAAARCGYLDVLKWLRSQDPPCPWDEETCESAAGNGHLDVLKWLRSQDPPCPWDESISTAAAGGGHLEILKWLRYTQNPPCVYSNNTCAQAAGNGHLDVLK